VGSQPPLSSEELQSALERTFEAKNSQQRIDRWTRVPSPHSATATLEELELEFHDGRHLRVIFKDPSRSMWPDGAIPDAEWDPAHEIRIYQGVLARMDLGTPACYGGIAGDERGRCWLFLEEVQGRTLEKVDDPGAWQAAARWLAAMHCRLQPMLPQLQQDVGLPVRDEEYFRQLTARALSNLRRVRGAEDEIAGLFETLIDGCHRALGEISNLPRTLIHGDFHSKNILVGSGAGGVRICVIDWEKTAEAPGLLDLATLVSRTKTAEDANALALAYYDEMTSQTPDYLAQDDFLRLLERCRLWIHLRRMTSHDRWLSRESLLKASVWDIQQLCGTGLGPSTERRIEAAKRPGGTISPDPHNLADVSSHPAVRAWRQLQVGCVPTSVENVRFKNWKESKTLIYRLRGCAHDERHVIAKCCRASKLEVERLVYLEMLGPLGMDLPHCYGYAADSDGISGWLFLEEVCGVPYSENDRHHRSMASAWLAKMHVATSQLGLPSALPVFTLDRYWRDLDSALESLSRDDIHRDGKGKHRRVLTSVERALERVRKRRSAIGDLWNRAPRCLVHGDFFGKNALVDGGGADPKLRVLDWESSGWGVPLEDLAGLDITVYASHAAALWKDFGEERLRLLADVSSAVRVVAFIEAYAGVAADRFCYVVDHLAHYGSMLEGIEDRLGW